MYFKQCTYTYWWDFVSAVICNVKNMFSFFGRTKKRIQFYLPNRKREGNEHNNTFFDTPFL